jgi:hypothetical protein
VTAPAVEIIAPVDAMNDAMTAATADGLPSEASVRIVDRASTTADVVAEVQWADGDRRHARLVVRTKDGRSTERILDFAAGDPPRERGRAIGFAVAAMIPEDLRVPDATADATPARRLPEPVVPAPPPTAVPDAPPAKEPDRARLQPSRRSSLWLEASAQGGVGVGGSATGLGGALAARVPFAHVALRIGGAIRGGHVDEANAASTLFRADGGVSFFTVVLHPDITVGARAGLLVLHHSLARIEPSGTRTAGTHTLLGAEALAEGSFAFSPRIAALLAAGAEVAFGQTAVVVTDARVAVLPPIRLVSELGLRFSF